MSRLTRPSMRRRSEEFEDAVRAAIRAGLLALLLAKPSSSSSQRPLGGSRFGSVIWCLPPSVRAARDSRPHSTPKTAKIETTDPLMLVLREFEPEKHVQYIHRGGSSLRMLRAAKLLLDQTSCFAAAVQQPRCLSGAPSPPLLLFSPPPLLSSSCSPPENRKKRKRWVFGLTQWFLPSSCFSKTKTIFWLMCYY